MKQHKRVPRHLVKYQEKEILERLTKRLKMAKFNVIEGGKSGQKAEKQED
jgi:choline kinase